MAESSTNTLRLGGLIPFFLGAIACYLPNAEIARHALMAMTFYAAVILSFLGGVRWGVLINVLDSENQHGKLPWSGMVLSVVPSLIAWPALMLRPLPALSVLIAGFIIQYGLDVIAARRGDLPRWYGMSLRSLLSIGAIGSLLVALSATVIRTNV